MDALSDLSPGMRMRDRYCPACGHAGRYDVNIRRCPGCRTRWPKRTKENDETAKRKVAEIGSRQ